MELTLEQLTKNMCKGETNYIRLVRHHAYYKLMHHNDMVDYMKSIIQETREHHETNPTCIIHPDGYKYYDCKKKKYKYYTIYTKTPRYRSYRQQLAITYRQLEDMLREWLRQKTSIEMFSYYNKKYTIAFEDIIGGDE